MIDLFAYFYSCFLDHLVVYILHFSLSFFTIYSSEYYLRFLAIIRCVQEAAYMQTRCIGISLDANELLRPSLEQIFQSTVTGGALTHIVRAGGASV